MGVCVVPCSGGGSVHPRSGVSNTPLPKFTTVPFVLVIPMTYKFSQLVPSKIIKTVATRCHILRPKCTKFDFGWGSAPDLVAGFRGSYF